MDPEKNPLLRAAAPRRCRSRPDSAGSASSCGEDGPAAGRRRSWSPLLCLEASDIVFAIDSVPAIFALTREPLIVFTSNVFAILGLRSMYFLLGGAVERFHLLRYGLAVVLVFVGLKMVWLDAWYGGKFPIGISLAIIASVIAASIGGSLLFPKAPAEAAAGPVAKDAGPARQR